MTNYTAIVRPKLKGEALFGNLVGQIAALFVQAWIVMLLAGAILPTLLGPEWALGYWHTLGFIYIVRSLLPPRSLAPRLEEVKQ